MYDDREGYDAGGSLADFDDLDGLFSADGVDPELVFKLFKMQEAQVNSVPLFRSARTHTLPYKHTHTHTGTAVVHAHRICTSCFELDVSVLVAVQKGGPTEKLAN